MRNLLVWLVFVALVGCLPGCGAWQQRKSLENVAKDWCMGIRASQAIPVYPPMEDVQPGDVYLVTLPAEKQVKLYTKSGFLPLDLLYTRLKGLDYKSFYGDAYWKGTYSKTPFERPGRSQQQGQGQQPAWSKPVPAPKVSFPSYSFSVDGGANLGLSVPISGVPVGLNLMHSNSATGSIKINDAYTVAVDGETVLAKLREWAQRPGTVSRLRILARNNEQCFLRVVYRVYLAGGIDLSMINKESQGADLKVKAFDGLDLRGIATNSTTAQEYAAVAQVLSQATASASPGGALSIAQATARSVLMHESFSAPLVVGYLSFDLPVLQSGDLGPPVTTSTLLVDGPEAFKPKTMGSMSREEYYYKALKNDIRGMAAARQRCIVQTAAKELPREPFNAFTEMAEDADVAAEAKRFLRATDDWIAGDGGTVPTRLLRVLDLLEIGMTTESCR